MRLDMQHLVGRARQLFADQNPRNGGGISTPGSASTFETIAQPRGVEVRRIEVAGPASASGRAILVGAQRGFAPASGIPVSDVVVREAIEGYLQNVSPNAFKATAARQANNGLVSERLALAIQRLWEGKDIPSQDLPATLAFAQFLNTRFGTPKTALANVTDVAGINTASDKSIVGMLGYESRSMAMTSNRDDIAVIPDNTPRWVVETLGAVRKLAGLSVPILTSRSDFEANRAESEAQRDTYESFRTERSSDKRSLWAQKVWNDKNQSMMLLNALDPTLVPELFYVGPAGQLDPRKLKTYPCMLKLHESASGLGVWTAENPEQLKQLLSTLSPSQPVQLQQRIVGDEFSIQFEITDAGPVLPADTKQRILNHMHQGNDVPSRGLEQQDIARSMKAAWLLWLMDYRGTAAADLIKPKDGGPAKIIEINCRPTGVTNPLTTGTSLGEEEWVARHIYVSDHEALNVLIKNYHRTEERKEGIVINNLIPTEDGRIKVEAQFFGKDGGRELEARMRAAGY